MRRPSPSRHRDDHPHVEYFGAGESYRPGGPSSETSYRPQREREKEWTIERRDDRRRDEIDSYIPPTSSRAQRQRSRSPVLYRQRSRSPTGRLRTELFPDRDRSSRRYSPPQDNRPRSPVRLRSRSPYQPRARSPDGRYARDYSPRRRSPFRDGPPSIPRDRHVQPRSPPQRPSSTYRDADQRPLSRSPPRRDERRPNYAEESWRRRSPSPRHSGPASGTTSRRSSPPIHLDRVSQLDSGQYSPAYDNRSQFNVRRNDNRTRPKSPSRDGRPSRARDDLGGSRERTPKAEYRSELAPAPPSGPRATSYDRSAPAGPSQSYKTPAPLSPGPKLSEAASAQSHTLSSGTFAAPTRPRGGRHEQLPRDFVSPPGAIRGRTSITYRAPGYRPPSTLDSTILYPSATISGPSPSVPSASTVLPSGPRSSSYNSRGDFSSRGRGDYPSRQSSYHSDFSHRGVNSNLSTTYPRTQRFGDSVSRGGATPSTSTLHNSNGLNTVDNTIHSSNPNYLSTLEHIIPGGKRLPTGLSPEQEKRLNSLQDEADRLRSEVVAKQKVKRAAENEWEVKERESKLAALRSELADRHLRSLIEEDGMTSTAF